MIVSALSERYVQEQDQHTRNLLKAAALTGAQLRLTAPVLDEVLAHLRKTDREYYNYIEPIGPIDSYKAIRQIPHILIRAFLYTQLFGDNSKPFSWESFMDQFCDHPLLHRPDAVTQLRKYLTSQFGFEFESWTEVNKVCNQRRHASLKRALTDVKSDPRLAETDAYVYELVITRRITRPEEELSPEYGYQTWWLSFGEDAAARAMARVDRSTHRILMRPEFLAKYIQLAPSASVARENLKDFLPNVQSIRLAP